MRHDKLERELELLQLLAENRSYSVCMLCQRLGISRRNLYYYLEFFRDCGFVVEKHGQCYSIDRSSPYFSRLFDRVAFTETEAVALRQLLSQADSRNTVLEGIRRKLDRFYDFDILTNDELRQRAARHVGTIYEAIKLRQMVVLKGYSSPHSQSQRDRVVEPFMLMNGNNEVRCYEPASQMNKTFKIARMSDVQLLDLRWSHEDCHRQMFTDIFMFSDERQLPVSLRLGRLAHDVLLEEYPRAQRYVEPADDGDHWRLQLPVCSYRGIGRFVLGLYSDIDILATDDFRQYIRQQIKSMEEKSSD